MARPLFAWEPAYLSDELDAEEYEIYCRCRSRMACEIISREANGGIRNNTPFKYNEDGWHFSAVVFADADRIYAWVEDFSPLDDPEDPNDRPRKRRNGRLSLALELQIYAHGKGWRIEQSYGEPLVSPDPSNRFQDEQRPERANAADAHVNRRCQADAYREINAQLIEPDLAIDAIFIPRNYYERRTCQKQIDKNISHPEYAIDDIAQHIIAAFRSKAAHWSPCRAARSKLNLRSDLAHLRIATLIEHSWPTWLCRVFQDLRNKPQIPIILARSLAKRCARSRDLWLKLSASDEIDTSINYFNAADLQNWNYCFLQPLHQAFKFSLGNPKCSTAQITAEAKDLAWRAAPCRWREGVRDTEVPPPKFF